MLSRHINGAHEKIGVFRVDDDSFQPLQYREMDGLVGLVAQFHQDWSGRFPHCVGTEDTGAQFGNSQA